MENPSIAEIKVKEKDLCVQCRTEMKTISLGGDSIFGSFAGRGAFYCENNKCKFFGYLTVGRIVHTEKQVELKSDKEK